VHEQHSFVAAAIPAELTRHHRSGHAAALAAIVGHDREQFRPVLTGRHLQDDMLPGRPAAAGKPLPEEEDVSAPGGETFRGEHRCQDHERAHVPVGHDRLDAVVRAQAEETAVPSSGFQPLSFWPPISLNTTLPSASPRPA